MSSNIEIQRICQFCNEFFIAKTTATKFCSDKCSKLAYKQKIKKKKIDESNKDTLVQLNSTNTSILKNKDYLTPTNAALLLGVSRATMYRYLADNIIKCVVMRGKTFIRRLDIETLFDNATPYEKRICRDRVPITEFYTIEEIKKIYNLKESWIYKMVKEKKIPKVFHRGKNLYSKNRVDKIFADKKPDGSITEWYSVEELQAKFKMTTTAVYSFVYENKIPKKKEGRKVYYSKKHFDVAKGIEKPEEPQYYTSKEAMVKFGLTKDMLYHYVTYHNIPKLKEGRSIKISKKHFDNIFENPVIQ